MKKYCRYCIHLCVNNIPFCAAKQETRSVSSCKRANNCKEFIFAEVEPEYQDAFGETKGYKERIYNGRHKNCEGQLSFDLLEEKNDEF